MPRDGSGIYSAPAGSNTVTAGTTILSALHNSLVNDLVSDANAARPITAGGTGSTSASAARTALGLAIGSDVQAYDADTAKTDVANTWTQAQTFSGAVVLGNHIVKSVNNSNTVISGGDTTANGANLELYGGTHATQANNAFIDADTITFRSQSGSTRATISSAGLQIADGTAAAPSFAFTSDTNTGFYSVSADTIGITAGGSVVGYYNTTGLTAATTTSAATFGSVAAVKNLSSGQIDVTRDNGTAIRASRMNGDGLIVSFHDEATLAGSVQLAAGGVTYNETSDGRFKIDRVPVEVEIDVKAVWDAVEPLAYTKLHGETGEPIPGRQFGLIAQDLYKVFPHAVTPGKGEPGDEDFEQWQIGYSRLVPLIIARQKQFEREVLARLAALGV